MLDSERGWIGKFGDKKAFGTEQQQKSVSIEMAFRKARSAFGWKFTLK